MILKKIELDAQNHLTRQDKEHSKINETLVL
jgi:hypothetical protein